MKTRIAVHIALNAKNKRVGSLVEAAGRLIPFEGWCFTRFHKEWSDREASEWINDDYSTEPTLKEWKKEATKFDNAARFQRVTLTGESNEN